MSDLDLVLSELANRDALSDLAGMLLIRHAELLLAEEAQKKTFGTPIHLAIGQEAVAIGISKWLRKSDLIFGNHRSHAHFLSTGAPLKSLFSEILGRSSGASGGKGGSMHLKFPHAGLMGTMPIVAGTIPIAVGAALTKRRPNNSDIAVIYFGDGAAEEGVFHESLNLARILNLPILFVCENNIYSSHLHIEERQPKNDIARFAKAHDIKSFTVDGNKVAEVTQVANSAISYCRDTRQPVMIEAHTYRLYGHVGFQKDQNVGLYRDKELPEWEKKDPLVIESEKGIIESRFSENEINVLKTKIKDYVAMTWKDSLMEPYPVDSELTSNVFFKELK
jgi:TPP-dependent pyruvate/acetoin dehydrogenase alpha subunit